MATRFIIRRSAYSYFRGLQAVVMLACSLFVVSSLDAQTAITAGSQALLAGWDFDNILGGTLGQPSRPRYSDVFGNNSSSTALTTAGGIYFNGTLGSDNWGTVAKNATGDINRNILTRTGSGSTYDLGGQTGTEGAADFNNANVGVTFDEFSINLHTKDTVNSFERLSLSLWGRDVGNTAGGVTVNWFYSVDGGVTKVATGLSSLFTGNVYAESTVDFSSITPLNSLADIYLIGQVVESQTSVNLNLDNIGAYAFALAAIPTGNTFWQGGAGVWDKSTTNNWLDAVGSSNPAGPWTAGGTATFGGTAGLVTVDNTGGDVEFAGATFLTTGYTITGSALKTTAASTTLAAGTDISATISAPITGTGGLNKTGAGTIILAGANTYTGGTTVAAGTLQQGGAGGFVANTAYTVNGGTLDLNSHALTASSLAGTGGTVALGSAALTVNQSANTTYAGLLTGSGGLTKSGAGTLTLSGANTNTGATTVSGGKLLINGNQTAATGAITVATGGTLGGIGATGGIVTVQDGGTLSGQSGGTFTMSGLVLGATSNVAVTLGAPGTTELFKVNGNLTLDGNLNITAGTGFGEGLYRLFLYTGTLTNNTLVVGTAPGAASAYTIQTSVAKQVNIISAPVTFPIWTGESNTWSASPTASGWGSADGAETGGWQPGLAIFAGNGGTITVDPTAGPVVVKGIQLADDDFTIGGGALTTNTANAPFRVGDGTSAGANMTGTISAPIIGTGGVDKTDLGTLVLSGTNTYTGGTRVSAGTLEVASDTALGGAAGTLRLAGGTLRAGANLTSARSVAITATGSAIDTGANNVTLSGPISGSGSLTKRGTGSLTVSGTNTNTGATTVSEGALILNASSLGATTVAQGARLAGTGTIRGNLANSGTLSPGASPGTITIVGNFTQSAGGTYVAEIASATSHDKLVVSGTATLGGTLTVTGLNGFVPGTGQTFKIIEAAGGVTGTFASIVSPWSQISAMRSFKAFYGSNDVSLGFLQLPFAGISGATANQKAIGAAVDGALADGTMATLGGTLNGLPTTAAVLTALDQLSPQRYERWFEQAVYNAAATMRMAENHMTTRAGARRKEGEGQGGLWLEMVRRETRFDANEAEGSLQARGTSDGIVVGGDIPLSRLWQLGALFGYTNETLQLDSAGSSTAAERFNAALYARLSTPLFLEAVAGMNYAKLDSRRTIAAEKANPAVAESKVDSGERYLGLRTGFPFRIGTARVTPYMAMNYVRWSADETTESGAGNANLTLSNQSADSLSTRTGVAVAWPFSGKKITVTPRLDLGWWHEFRSDPRIISAELGGNLFSIQSRTPSSSGMTAGFGLDAAFGARFSAYARFASEWATTVDESLEARAGVDYRF